VALLVLLAMMYLLVPGPLAESIAGKYEGFIAHMQSANIRYVLSLLVVSLNLDPAWVAALSWLVGGAAGGIVIRKWKSAALVGVCAGIFGGWVIFAAIWIANPSARPSNYLEETKLFYYWTLNGLVGGASIMAAIGALVAAHAFPRKPKRLEETGVQSFNFACHNCGATFSSSTKYCSSCGESLARKVSQG